MNPDSLTDPSVTLRTRFRTATRDAILDAAAALFAADEASHVRMEDIAARAGIAVGTLYNYFEDRTALIGALLDARSERLCAALDTAVGTVAPADAEAFEAMLLRFVTVVGRHFDDSRVLLSVIAEDGRRRGIDASAATRRRSVLAQLHTRAGRVLAHGVRLRVLRRAEPGLHAALLIGMVRGLVLHALDRRRSFPAQGAAQVVRTFLRGAGQ